MPSPFIEYRPLPFSRLRVSAVATLGPLLFVLGYWSIRGRWRRVLLVSMLTIFIAAILVVPSVANLFRPDERPLESDERYSWQGW